MQQHTALDILRSGHNVFLTGAAGAGKTYVLNQYIRYLRERDVPVAVTASTGIAATHLGGMTIHAWSGLGIKDELSRADLDKIGKNRPVRKRVTNTAVLIIDEVSMLSARTLSNIDRILKFFKDPQQPFGGLQIIFSGDFFQLPPVSRVAMPSRDKFAFMAPVWVEAGLKIAYLHGSFRHGDPHLLALLDSIRAGHAAHAMQPGLNEKLVAAAAHRDPDAINLYTHNADVDAINRRELQRLTTPAKTWTAETRGNPLLVEMLKKSVLAPETLTLKVGAKVMFVKNNFEDNYMNGTLGVVQGFTAEQLPRVKTLSGQHIVVKPADWSLVNEFDQILAAYTQIPLRPAWAITIHKSQGMTLDRAIVDLSRTFEPGQGYVALSRVKTWAGLTLLGCNELALQVDSLAGKADLRFQALAAEVEAEFTARSATLLQQQAEQHILRCGGTLDPEQIQQNRTSPRRQAAPKPKGETYAATKALLATGKTLTEIAAERELKPSTIIRHLAKLRQDDPALDLSAFKPPAEQLEVIGKALQTCQAAATDETLDRQGRVKSSAIFQYLNEAYSYDDIHLARLFLEPPTAQ